MREATTEEILIKMAREQAPDEVLMSQKVNMSLRRYLLMSKYRISKEELVAQTERRDKKLYFRENIVFHLKCREMFSVDVVEVKGNHLVILGRTNLSYYREQFEIAAIEKTTKQRIAAQIEQAPAFDQFIEEGVRIFESYQFRFELPLKDGNKYRFVLVEKTTAWEMTLEPVFQYWGKFHEKLKKSFYCDSNWLFRFMNNEIQVFRYSLLSECKAEYRYYEELQKKEEKKYREIFKYRILSKLKKLFARKELWLISDRPNLAGDNGEAFFEYAASKKEVNAYFLLDKASSDYKRLKKIGKVIPYGSVKHKVYFLAADKLISASADDWVFNIMDEYSDYVKDLYQFDYIFLQHGVIMKDFSSWLHRCKKNIKVFVTTALGEHASIVHGDYGYTDQEVLLTGLPRYDRLTNNPQKVIAIMPTWRKGIAAEHVPLESNPQILVRGYSKDFVNTEYYHFYQGLLDHERFREALKSHGYQCVFYLHSSFAKQIDDFKANDENVSIYKGTINYSEVFEKSALFVTDYSSTAIDFAYLKKPVIYSQFDPETFLHGHTGKAGYFDFEQNGFGPICKTIEETVDAIISCMEQQCCMDEQYVKRVEAFYGHNDRKNCERVYEAIRALPQKKG